ncbi:SCYL1 protein, partial [Rhinopomastus cyanomelas]|nr:SCYL1 protein [Rhinopomastus cyanomelas]
PPGVPRLLPGPFPGHPSPLRMWFFSRDPVRDFPFDLGPPEPEPDPGPTGPAPLWRLLRGRRKADGTPVSIFTHSLGGEGTPLARAALKRLRSLRHPNILGYLDSLETEQSLLVVTELVIPLRQQLQLRPPQGPLGEQEVAWGLHQLLVRGRPQICGMGICWDGGDPKYGRGNPNVMWEGWLGWGEVLHQLLVRGYSKDLGGSWDWLVATFSELVAAEPSQRPSPGQLLQRLQQPGAFITGPLVSTGLQLERLQVLDPPERRQFLQDLGPLLDSLPGPFRRHKVLPALLGGLRLGTTDACALPPLLKVAKELDPPEFQEQIVPVLVQLFASPDRALRLRLLQQLEEFVGFLPAPTVDSQIFPHVARGFLDTNAAIREQTVKSMVLLAPKLGEGRLAGELPRLLLRVQGGDELGPLRCNATICLGRLGPLLPPQTRARVLAPALARATRDPFAPCRAAAVAAFAATHQLYAGAEVAQRVLPPLCALTVDPHPGVRQQ